MRKCWLKSSQRPSVRCAQRYPGLSPDETKPFLCDTRAKALDDAEGAAFRLFWKASMLRWRSS